MQESCTCGSVRGASGNRRPYRDRSGFALFTRQSASLPDLDVSIASPLALE